MFAPYAYPLYDGLTREVAINDSTYGCAKTGAYCAWLIMNDGWKIADDYPWL